MRLPSTRTCEPFLRLSRTYCPRRVRKIATRCHSVFETHSSSVFFQERCVASESTVNFMPLPFACRCSGSAPRNPTSVTELRYMSFSFFCPIFLRHPEARAAAPKASGCIPGGNRRFSGGTGKAEDAKLPGAGIRPKPCPGKGAAEKGHVPDPVTIARGREQDRQARADKAGSRRLFRGPVERISEP